ncbi:hypothetical protein BD289DRAFT_437034 [Coniella lustricola]|uniref:X-Pro dipeptidyl-peptidase n=1 Tax=Coniella lustricola TaxID=2025994 RepID=A0A2T3A4G3_9PEZI|nr:hypothetical protein BD289DRAFT_437034 [Coniella lustricola]
MQCALDNSGASGAGNPSTTMSSHILRVTADERHLKEFWTVPFSPARSETLSGFYASHLQQLAGGPFDNLSHQDKVDYLLLQSYLWRGTRREVLDAHRNNDAAPLLPFAPALVRICEMRQACHFEALEPRQIASVFDKATAGVTRTREQIETGKIQSMVPMAAMTKEAAYRALKNLKALQACLKEMHAFFHGYHPTFDWWVQAPYAALDKALDLLATTIATKLVGMQSPGGDEADEIVGEPIGRRGLLVELEAEMIPYAPEELLTIAREKYAWCEKEMQRAANELGYGSDWKAALRHVQNIYVDPGEQPRLVRSLVEGGIAYVKRHDLVTVPKVAEQSWRMFMMSPARQKANPFFLGGPSIIVSYPTGDMAHNDKMMSMRSNGPHLSKATAFHEMIPGHHLQMAAAESANPHRKLFETPFYVEGWAMYWELVFWERGDFFTSPEDRIGTLFWRMHRCARILFSLGFHLGELTPQQCVDLLVDKVGHQRATAEGEVRRSLNGDYGPLYQAGYYLGAMQLWALRSEVLARGRLSEKEFHDAVLEANNMPIELLRALLLDEPLTRNYESHWRFYNDE